MPPAEPLFVGGKVTTQYLVDEAFAGEKIQMVNVSFAPGARNKFHTHTTHQILFVLEGEGILADRQKEYKMTPGMAAYISAGESTGTGPLKTAPLPIFPSSARRR
jgi:quercetin dioxygenase-like cupin family protein